MKYKINRCKIMGILKPGILIEGWIYSKIDSLLLYANGEIIWENAYSEKEEEVSYFRISQMIPRSRSLHLVARFGSEQVELSDIPAHIGVRICNKLQSCFYKPIEPKENQISVNTLSDEIYNPFVPEEYREWIKNNPVRYSECTEFEYSPLISIIIPVYNIEERYLSECIMSVLEQTYQNFEICIADDYSSLKETIETLKQFEKKDSRIKISYREVNGHISIASNTALELANGEYIGFLDNDDVLDIHALEAVVKALNTDKTIEFIYTDEDKLDLDGERIDPHFKPDFAIDNLLVANYICHFSVLKKTLLDEIGWFKASYEGAQDYDLFLRAVEKAVRVYHIPEILYHWRQIPGSTALEGDGKSYAVGAGRKAIEDHVERNNIDALVEQVEDTISYRVAYRCNKEEPVDVVILSDGNLNKIRKMLEEWKVQVLYRNYRFVIWAEDCKINNELVNYIDDMHIQLVESIEDFNNYAVKKSSCTHFLFWDIDNIMVDANWMKTLISYANNKSIGVVGSRVFNSEFEEFSLGYAVVSPNKIIPIKQWYIAMRYAPINRYVVGKKGYVVSRQHFVTVGGFTQCLDRNVRHFDLQIKVHNLLKRNIVVPQVYFLQEECIGRGEMISDLKSMIAFTHDPFYNSNFSKEIAYQL